MVSDGLKVTADWKIDKFVDLDGKIAELGRKGVSIEEIKRVYAERFRGQELIRGNVGLNEGIQALLDLVFGLDTPTLFDDTTGYIGVGDDDSAPTDATKTGLVSVLAYVVFDDTYPSRSGQTVTVRSTFAPAVATGDWKEFTIANGNSDAAVNLNRKVEDKGAKAAGETWIAEVQFSIA